ncbi:hypothetical protein GCM10010082_21750 [Kushneria pakistanensis]|uniref:DUF3253 domain-containing protein n=1 Tax=Kushneria pakistanensis TaxID=1508770 RepID=A0ABQ3FKN7_9GAMM|nr:DUF3253 domain-containing protein [Kushneria pakistanensis]GHC28111.1 hypothetical protein GCM10010082_21750 [Kushneria pakistanensis]
MREVSEEAIAETLMALAERRGRDKSFCPSEVARALYDQAHWREHMDEVRRVAADLTRRNRLEMLARGKRLSPDVAHRGPIRLRLC